MTARLLYGLIGILVISFLIAGFLAPYDYETQNRAQPLAPPSQLHFRDENGLLHIRPFVYAITSSTDWPGGSKQVRKVRIPILFFVRGEPYRLFGMQSSLHFFGTEPQQKIFLLGTDFLGRDVFSRLLYGGHLSILSGTAAAFTSALIGLLMGGISGYFGSWIDALLMRAGEVFLAVPWLYLLLLVRAALPPRLDPGLMFFLLMMVAGLVGWARPARLVRGLILSSRNREYVLAARGFGATNFYILRRHILPEVYGVALVQAAIYIPQYITAEVTLSFFGLGVSEPVPSWGNMLAQMRSLYVLQNCWWLFSPAVALMLILFLFQWILAELLRQFSVPQG